MYQRARWTGPIRSELSMADLVQMNLFVSEKTKVILGSLSLLSQVSDLIAEIDSASAA